MIQPNNTRFVYYGFMALFFFGSIITFYGFFSEFNKWKEIKKDSYITYAKIIKEEKNRFGGSNTFRYQVEYSYNNYLYNVFENGMYEAGHYAIGQKVKIIFQKRNPENFLIIENIKYKYTLILSICCFVLFLVMFKYREKAIAYIRKISPDY